MLNLAKALLTMRAALDRAVRLENLAAGSSSPRTEAAVGSLASPGPGYRRIGVVSEAAAGLYRSAATASGTADTIRIQRD